MLPGTRVCSLVNVIIVALFPGCFHLLPQVPFLWLTVLSLRVRRELPSTKSLWLLVHCLDCWDGDFAVVLVFDL